MDSLEHGGDLADVGTTGSTHTPLNLARLIGQDVAVEVRHHQHLELFLARRIDEGRRHNVDVPALPLDSGVALRYPASGIKEVAVGGLDNIGLGDHRHGVLAGPPGMGEGGVDDALRAPG